MIGACSGEGRDGARLEASERCAPREILNQCEDLIMGQFMGGEAG